MAGINDSTERWLRSLMSDCQGTNYCRHERWRLVSFTDRSNGGVSVRIQCQDCGSLVRAVKRCDLAAHGIDIRQLPPWDRSLRDRVSREVARQEADQRRCEYAAYLRSAEWKARRALVLERANHRCEGCGRRTATEVHHRIFQEMLFDLVAICASCHRLLHEDQADDAA